MKVISLFIVATTSNSYLCVRCFVKLSNIEIMFYLLFTITLDDVRILFHSRDEEMEPWAG